MMTLKMRRKRLIMNLPRQLMIKMQSIKNLHWKNRKVPLFKLMIERTYYLQKRRVHHTTLAVTRSFP